MQRTHKSYESLLILLEGTTEEILWMYLQEATQHQYQIGAESFTEWAYEIPYEIFNMIFPLIFNFVLAIHIQKNGVRANNSAMMQDGRYKFLPMFYGFRHLIYQELEYRELVNQAQCPNIVEEFLGKNMVNSSGLEMNHQGGDFCFENQIKRLKLVALKVKSPKKREFTTS